mmetsp:Transcript_15760/g.36711  ORF Transcript_15760/g.36711 Transcript_15760/m.36711 type:complete len:564 (-) Transcript_15760:2-1693(-)
MKMGTSGLRKKVPVVKGDPMYLKNFVQSIFDALPKDDILGGTLVVGGDGRYYNKEALQTIIRMAAANGVGRVWVGKEGLISTPAVSAIVREREAGAAFGAIVLTASHNPGGPDGDFGIKYNTGDGAPAKELLTEGVYDFTTKITRVLDLEDAEEVDLGTVGTSTVGNMVVEVIDPVDDYLAVLEACFDFPALKALVSRPDFSMVFDAMHGAAGPSAKRILGEALGVPLDSLMNCVPSEDFGGGHPDPNLAYAEELVKVMGLDGGGMQTAAAKSAPDFGAAADGDADRNMILGKGFFVTPSDSVAILAANGKAAIPQFAGGINGVARSMPTSGALDVVAEALDFSFFETPTGWKYFGNLMDCEQYTPFICGEESFGTGSSHIREKDGMWAVLAWMSVLANANPDESAPLVGIQEIVQNHWAKFGRHFYVRYDYEAVDSGAAEEVMETIRGHFASIANEGDKGIMFGGMKCNSIEEFLYVDPVDDSVTSKQGLILSFVGGARAIFRLSGTGSEGATIRLYLESYEEDVAKQSANPQEVLLPLAAAALEASNLAALTGRASPTVIT